MSKSKIDLEIDIDTSECVPTVRFNPKECSTKLERHVYNTYFVYPCWSESELAKEPITQRALPKR